MDRAEPVEGVEVGEIIGGYRLERLLGAGSVSRVFLGTHVRLGRRAAIKVLIAPMAEDTKVTQRFLNEARVVNDIRHPNIVDVSDFIESESPKRLALVMEYIEGPSLKSLNKQGEKLTFQQAIGVALQLCAAVEAAHGAGVIHRDLKPDNLLLTNDPTIDRQAVPGLKVVDFGIAKIAGPGEKTATGMMIGTPAYMAPEQIAGKPPPSPATDVFAIGEVIYELLTGKRAYPVSQVGAMIQTKLKGEMPKLDVPDVPGGIALKALVERCLATRPQDRPRIEEIRATLIGVCPDVDALISISVPPDREETVEPEPTQATKVPLKIPQVSTSPTLFVEADDSTTQVGGKPTEISYAPPPKPQPKRAPIGIAAAIAAVGILSVWAVWPKAQVVKIEQPVVEAIPAVVPRDNALQLVTSPAGAHVEDLRTHQALGQTPAAVAHSARVRLTMDGYETLELEMPAMGKSFEVELNKKVAKEKTKKTTKEKDPWEY